MHHRDCTLRSFPMSDAHSSIGGSVAVAFTAWSCIERPSPCLAQSPLLTTPFVHPKLLHIASLPRARARAHCILLLSN
eukprot:scaffold8234_cov116-Skeletonema_marinoi.AAC.5